MRRRGWCSAQRYRRCSGITPPRARSAFYRAPRDCFVAVLLAMTGGSILQREHPHHTALGHERLLAARLIEPRDHLLRVDAPAGLHRDVLHAVDFEGRRHAGHAGVRAELPELLARLRVERAEVAVARSAREHEA